MKWRFGGVQTQANSLGVTYTNTVRLKEQLRVLQDTLELQFAALECYKAVADFLPPELTLSSMRIARGRELSVSGTSGVDDRQKILEFYEALLKVEVRSQPLFAKGKLPDIRNQPGTQTANWSFAAELKRSDVTE